MTPVLVLALAAFYVTRLLRTLSLWLAARKPVGCNVCVSGWATWTIGSAAAYAMPWVIVEMCAAAGVCLVLLEVAEALRPPPVDLGRLE